MIKSRKSKAELKKQIEREEYTLTNDIEYFRILAIRYAQQYQQCNNMIKVYKRKLDLLKETPSMYFDMKAELFNNEN